MNILLLSPPLNSLTHPYSSLPSLTGFLRNLSHTVTQCDIGMEAMDALLTGEEIKSLSKRIAETLAELPHTPKHKKKRANLREALFIADTVIAEIDDAKKILRSEHDFYDPLKYVPARQIVTRALEIISALYSPFRFIDDTISMGKPPTFSNLSAFVENPALNPFDQIMRDILTRLIAKGEPHIVGISITYTWQIFFGFSLAKIVREIIPDAIIVLGGATINLAEDALRKYPAKAFQWCDAFVFGEGEGPLKNLLDIIEHPEGCNGIHKNLFISPDGQLQSSLDNRLPQICPSPDLNALPSPDYSGLALDAYLAPEILFMTGNTRGCYYGKCTFCSCSFGHMNRYLLRSIKKVEEDIRVLQERFGARHIFFTDDCIPPKRCREIADFLNDSGISLHWSGELRYERVFSDELVGKMARSGCCFVSFGNESASAEVLERMRKGTKLQESIDLLERISSAEIGIDLQNFIGFPGETKEQAFETLRFLLSKKNEITTASLGNFYVTHGSPIALQPEAYGLLSCELIDPENLEPQYRYSVSEGLSHKEAASLQKMFSGLVALNFPACSFFLDGSVGSHNILYHARFGATWVKKNLWAHFLRPITGMAKGEVIEWETGVRWMSNDEDASIFHENRATLLRVNQGAQFCRLIDSGYQLSEADMDKSLEKNLGLLLREGLARVRPKQQMGAFPSSPQLL